MFDAPRAATRRAENAAKRLARLRNARIARLHRNRYARGDSIPRVPQLQRSSDQRADGEGGSNRTARRPDFPPLWRAHAGVRGGSLDVIPSEARAPHRRLAVRIRGDWFPWADLLRAVRSLYGGVGPGRPAHSAH